MKILNLEDVCEHLKISIQTGRNRLSRGAPMPPSFRAGRRRLFLLTEVEKWVCDLAISYQKPLAQSEAAETSPTKELKGVERTP